MSISTQVSESLPTALSGAVNIPLSLAGIAVSASPRSGDPLVSVLSISVGALTANAGSGHAAIAGSGTSQLTLSGTAADINAALATAQFVDSAPGNLALTVTTTDTINNSQASGTVDDLVATSQKLFDFVYLYNDGREAYYGTVADDGSLRYQVGQTINRPGGAYTILGEDPNGTSQASGTVFVTDYRHAGPGQAYPMCRRRMARASPPAPAGSAARATRCSAPTAPTTPSTRTTRRALS